MNRIRLIVGLFYVIYLMIFMSLMGCQHELLVSVEPVPEGECSGIHTMACNPDT